MILMNINNMFHTFEITIKDQPLDEVEAMFIGLVAERHDAEFAISKSGRIMTISNVKDIKALISMLSEMGLAEDIGLIKEITEYWPEYGDEDIIINTTGDI